MNHTKKSHLFSYKQEESTITIEKFKDGLGEHIIYETKLWMKEESG